MLNKEAPAFCRSAFCVFFQIGKVSLQLGPASLVLTSAKMIQLTAAEDVNTISSMGSRRYAELLQVDPFDGRDSPREKMIRLAVKDSSSALWSCHFLFFFFF